MVFKLFAAILGIFFAMSSWAKTSLAHQNESNVSIRAAVMDLDGRFLNLTTAPREEQKTERNTVFGNDFIITVNYAGSTRYCNPLHWKKTLRNMNVSVKTTLTSCYYNVSEWEINKNDKTKKSIHFSHVSTVVEAK